MLIAIVANTSWNIINFRLGLVKSFLAQNHQVLVVAPLDDYSSKLTALGCIFEPIEIQNKGSNPMADLGLLYSFYKKYKKYKPDVILQFTIKPNIYGTLAAKVLSIPVINNVSGLGTVFLHNNLVSTVALLLYKFSFRFPYKVFFQNKDDKELFLSKKIVKEELVGLLPGSGVDLQKYQPVKFKKNEIFTFLLIARLLYDKGIVEFVEAIKILRAKGYKAKYIMVGAMDKESGLGVSEDQLNNWLSRGLVEYVPFTNSLVQYIYDADCIVLPSYREGTPKALLEGAACAKPLITTDVPGCKEVVTDGQNGYLCKVKDSVDLADKMLKMLQMDEAGLEQMGKESRKKVETTFDEKIVINLYHSCINSIPGLGK